MPPRKDAETGTETNISADVGNVDAQSTLLHDVDAMQELVLKQQEMLQKLAAEVDELREQKADVPIPPQLVKHEPPPVPKGAKRYAARYTELTLMRVGTGHEMHGGVAVPVPILTGKQIDFSGGVYQTSDPDEIEFIESHPDYGVNIWEDATAVRQHSQVEVVDGTKHTNPTPRVPLEAPMAPN